MTDDNYFDHKEEDALADAFAMIHGDKREYDNLREVIEGETIYDSDTVDWWLSGTEE